MRESAGRVRKGHGFPGAWTETSRARKCLSRVVAVAESLTHSQKGNRQDTANRSFKLTSHRIFLQGVCSHSRGREEREKRPGPGLPAPWLLIKLKRGEPHWSLVTLLLLRLEHPAHHLQAKHSACSCEQIACATSRLTGWALDKGGCPSCDGVVLFFFPLFFLLFLGCFLKCLFFFFLRRQKRLSFPENVSCSREG